MSKKIYRSQDERKLDDSKPSTIKEKTYKKNDSKNFKHFKNNTGGSGRYGKENKGKKITDNDIGWYANTPQLISDVGSLSYNEALGAPFNLGIPKSSTISEHIVPGILTLHWMPWIGNDGGSLSNASIINIAAKNIYTFVRHKNSGHTNYESSDLMMYIYAMINVYSMLAAAQRAIGVVQYYDRKNRYIPITLLNALGFSENPTSSVSLVNNLANYRAKLNQLIVKASALCVPGNLPLLKRYIWLNSFIFKDSDSEKAQLYCHVQQYGLNFNARSSTQGSSLEYVGIEGLSYSTYLNRIDNSLNQLLYDEDCNIMSGDIQKAYKDAALISLDTISENYIVQPEYNPEVLGQIQNSCTGLWTYSDIEERIDGGLTITQNVNSNNITCELVCPSPSSWGDAANWFTGTSFNNVINTYSSHPDPKISIINTRLITKTSARIVQGSLAHASHVTCAGSEILLKYSIVYDIKSNGSVDTTNAYAFTSYLNQADEAHYRAVVNMLSVFDMHPILYSYKFETDASSVVRGYIPYIIGDLDTYTVIDLNVLYRINDSCLLSEFDIPIDVNKYINDK